MATKTSSQSRERPGTSAAKEIARLRAQVTRLRARVRTLLSAAARAEGSPASVPPLPDADADGNYPAAETLRAVLARQIARRRAAAGWSQAELAAAAGVRQETVSRIESGKNAPNVATVDKLDRALKRAGV
jgi:ribosome-binding protein aMBF1 (putative translation factor)